MRTIMLAFALSAALSGAAVADPTIEITGAWARPTVAAVPNGAVYLTVANHGSRDDRVTGVSTPVAAKTEMHTTIDDHGVMKMRPLAALPVKAGKTAAFKPSAAHIMLVGLKQPLKAGDSFPLTLTFAKAGRIETKVMVMKQPPAGAKAGGMKDMNMPGM